MASKILSISVDYYYKKYVMARFLRRDRLREHKVSRYSAARLTGMLPELIKIPTAQCYTNQDGWHFIFFGPITGA